MSQSTNLIAECAPEKGHWAISPGQHPGELGATKQTAPWQGKSVIVGGMLMPLRGGITTRHTIPKALPWAIWLLVLQASAARAYIHWLVAMKKMIACQYFIRCNTTQIKRPDIISFHCNTTQNLSPFRGSVNGCVLSRGSVLRTSPPACILSCLWHYFIWNANGIDVKNPDK